MILMCLHVFVHLTAIMYLYTTIILTSAEKPQQQPAAKCLYPLSAVYESLLSTIHRTIINILA